MKWINNKSDSEFIHHAWVMKPMSCFWIRQCINLFTFGLRCFVIKCGFIINKANLNKKKCTHVKVQALKQCIVMHRNNLQKY